MRPESLYFLFSPITRVKGVGGATAKALANLLPPATNIAGASQPIVRDLLFHLPVGIVDRRFTCPLKEAPDGVIATFIVTVDQHLPPKRRGKSPYKVLCSNDSGDITLVFFHAGGDYIQKALPEGKQRVISGRVEHYDFTLQMPHPDIIAPVEQLPEVQKTEAVYPLTIGITSRRISKIVADAMEKLPKLPEWQTAAAMDFKTALMQAHRPQSEADLSSDTPARARLAYDEILANQLHLAILRRNMHKQPGEIITGTGTLTEALIKTLPFTLTDGQKKALKEIESDLASGHRMGRLLQGDVGSGKTIVALLAMLKAAEQGLQSALMVPTELIASQHYEVIKSLLAADIPSPLEGEGGEAKAEPGEGYNATTLKQAKDLRANLTDAEQKLWQLLRNRQLEQYKFRRQQPLGPYIADFFCAEYGLIVEADGGQHAERIAQDEKRTRYLESKGYRVLRFWNNEILQNPEGVGEMILATINTPHPAPPPMRGSHPLPQGERELVTLLTGSVKGKQREQVLKNIQDGEAKIVIGTHALFQEHVEFKNLAFIVIDEQHRFGVGQRMALSEKGEAPHILHMTATPIPRSLTMTLYGDMDISQLTEKPAGRQAITTRIIPASRYGEVVERLEGALDRGEKAYWICPLIEDTASEFLEKDLAAAKSRFAEFKARFGGRVGLVHGKMKADERNAEMRKFTEGKTQLLVATTVIEVGVDVKDATIMVVEQAERFGLAQLHQLRGRVGRGEKPSACVLLYSGGGRGASGEQKENFDSRPSPLDPVSRLSILRETDDGFKIADADLVQRGGGDLLGTRQSGLPRFIFMDLFKHQELIRHARDDVKRFLESDPELKSSRGEALRLLLQLFGWE